MRNKERLLTTKELAELSGISVSFFEKGRVLGYGPPWFKLRGGVRYLYEDYLAWLARGRNLPGGSYD